MGETITKKPLNEYKLTQSEALSVKGTKGFRKLDKPKDEVFQIRINNEVKKFMTEYCQKHGITKTQLLMGALECYTGFNGDNASECLNDSGDILLNM
jgi:hypothetical protein